MSLASFFNDSFADFDRMFDEAFARRTSGGQFAQNQPASNNTSRVLCPRYACPVLVLIHITVPVLTLETESTCTRIKKRTS